MRRRMPRALIYVGIIGIILLLTSYGCAGARVVITPDPQSIEPPSAKGCGNVAVTDINSSGTSKIPSEFVLGFAKIIERSGLFEEVYCPVRSSDTFNLTINSKFEVQIDNNNARNNTKSFFIGFTLFLLEPIIWYEQNIYFSGHVDMIREDKTIASFDAKTKADLYRKLLSLDDTDAFYKELWPKGLISIYAQLLRDIELYCKDSTRATKR